MGIVLQSDFSGGARSNEHARFAANECALIENMLCDRGSLTSYKGERPWNPEPIRCMGDVDADTDHSRDYPINGYWRYIWPTALNTDAVAGTATCLADQAMHVVQRGGAVWIGVTYRTATTAAVALADDVIEVEGTKRTTFGFLAGFANEGWVRVGDLFFEYSDLDSVGTDFHLTAAASTFGLTTPLPIGSEVTATVFYPIFAPAYAEDVDLTGLYLQGGLMNRLWDFDLPATVEVRANFRQVGKYLYFSEDEMDWTAEQGEAFLYAHVFGGFFYCAGLATRTGGAQVTISGYGTCPTPEVAGVRRGDIIFMRRHSAALHAYGWPIGRYTDEAASELALGAGIDMYFTTGRVILDVAADVLTLSCTEVDTTGWGPAAGNACEYVIVRTHRVGVPAGTAATAAFNVLDLWDETAEDVVQDCELIWDSAGVFPDVDTTADHTVAKVGDYSSKNVIADAFVQPGDTTIAWAQTATADINMSGYLEAKFWIQSTGTHVAAALQFGFDTAVDFSSVVGAGKEVISLPAIPTANVWQEVTLTVSLTAVAALLTVNTIGLIAPVVDPGAVTIYIDDVRFVRPDDGTFKFCYRLKDSLTEFTGNPSTESDEINTALSLGNYALEIGGWDDTFTADADMAYYADTVQIFGAEKVGGIWGPFYLWDEFLRDDAVDDTAYFTARPTLGEELTTDQFAHDQPGGMHILAWWNGALYCRGRYDEAGWLLVSEVGAQEYFPATIDGYATPADIPPQLGVQQLIGSSRLEPILAAVPEAGAWETVGFQGSSLLLCTSDRAMHWYGKDRDTYSLEYAFEDSVVGPNAAANVQGLIYLLTLKGLMVVPPGGQPKLVSAHVWPDGLNYAYVPERWFIAGWNGWVVVAGRETASEVNDRLHMFHTSNGAHCTILTAANTLWSADLPDLSDLNSIIAGSSVHSFLASLFEEVNGRTLQFSWGISPDYEPAFAKVPIRVISRPLVDKDPYRDQRLQRVTAAWRAPAVTQTIECEVFAQDSATYLLPIADSTLCGGGASVTGVSGNLYARAYTDYFPREGLGLVLQVGLGNAIGIDRRVQLEWLRLNFEERTETR